GLGLAFAWLADRPGDLVVTFLNTRYEVSLTTALAAFLVGVAAIMVAWWAVRSVIDGPQSARRYFRARRRDRGYQALSTGMIAAGSGDGATARKLAQRASSFISADQEPLIHYLGAQVALLEGNNADARKAFEAMLDNGETKALGLRGLYLEAQRINDPVAARHFAEKAFEASPTLDWAADAAISGHARDGAWDKALAIVDGRKRVVGSDRQANDRKRAVLLTAKAIATIDSDAATARNAAVEANRLAPGLVPAAIIAGRALFKTDELRKGAKILEAAWKLNPHPGLADTYVHARLGDSAIDRMKRAAELVNLQPGRPEGLLALASAQLAAGEHKAARKSVETVLKSNPSESAWLLLADIEEAETGNEGRVREWLQRAVKAPRDAAWVADGQISDHWLPFSPMTGRLDAFEWKVPVMLLQSEAPEIDAETFDRMREVPAKVENFSAEPAAIVQTVEPMDEAETLDAETALRSAGFKPAADATETKKKGGFRLF
ncbi:MAG: heme biosynthesis protein HemY, partial [Notoacmeibacter sp.]